MATVCSTAEATRLMSQRDNLRAVTPTSVGTATWTKARPRVRGRAGRHAIGQRRHGQSDAADRKREELEAMLMLAENIRT